MEVVARYNKAVNIYIPYEISLWSDIQNADFALRN